MNLSLEPSVLRWARERAGLSPELLAEKIKTKLDRVVAWERTGELRFAQAQNLAKVTHTPFGFLFLREPPDEPLGIPDFRTVADGPIGPPSPELIDTVREMQRRQAWLREWLIEDGAEPLSFIGSVRTQAPPQRTAARMRETLGLLDGWAQLSGTWTDALRQFRQRIEAAGILIVINGSVGNNAHRTLSVQEFRGFALSDSYAPLIFVNGADGKAAQLFTMAHELAHLYQVLARRFKVSPIVAARRATHLGSIARPEFLAFYRAYAADERRRQAAKNDGGSFWNSQTVRIGERFGVAVARAAKEGRLLDRDADRLTGLWGENFAKFPRIPEWMRGHTPVQNGHWPPTTGSQ